MAVRKDWLIRRGPDIKVVDMTYLAVSIKVETIDGSKDSIARATADGAEMLELRLDYLERAERQAVKEVVGFARRTGCPVLATCRPTWEGGCFRGGESLRQDILKQATEAGADHLDIELAGLNRSDSVLKNLLNSPRTKIIISKHDFEKPPPDLMEIYSNVKEYNPPVIKLAYQASKIDDSFLALDIMHQEAGRGSGIIALAMGEAGVISRLLAKKLGAYLTFASPAEGAESAPGQPTVKQMKDTYLWDSINAGTNVFGVIGWPIAHSMSPAVHNAAFKAIGYNGLYLPLPVEPGREAFFGFLDGIRHREWLDFRGASVTIPHKKNAHDYVKGKGGFLEPLAAKLRSVNTIRFDPGGMIQGYNTDYGGALDAITGALGVKWADLSGIRAAVIGAGGVARAIVGGLIDVGAEVIIYNRTVENARCLAEEFDCRYAPLDNMGQLNAKLVVNATSIGMYPNESQSVIKPELLNKDMIVFDTVYNPPRTLLLRQAEAAGARVIEGSEMFVNQAAAQFELFTGQSAPKDLMHQIVKNHLTRNIR